MAVDLNDLVDSLKREISPPGTNLYPDARGSEYLGHLIDAFWEAKLFGMMDDWVENAAARGGPAAFEEGVVTPTGALAGYDDPDGYVDADMGRDRQQLIVLYAGYRIVLASFQNLKSMVSYKAGPVEYKTQQSAQVIKGVLDAIRERIKLAIMTISTSAGMTSVSVFDAVIDRTYNTVVGDNWWVK